MSTATDVWGIGAVLRAVGLEDIAARCLLDDPAQRPSIDDVVRWLDVKAVVRACAPDP